MWLVVVLMLRAGSSLTCVLGALVEWLEALSGCVPPVPFELFLPLSEVSPVSLSDFLAQDSNSLRWKVLVLILRT